MNQPKDYCFQVCTLGEISNLRKLKIKDYKAQIQAFIEEGIVTYHANCILITKHGKEIGYVCIGNDCHRGNTILEFFIDEDYRIDAGKILGEIKLKHHCTGWYVNTQDSFALPLMIDLKLPFETDGFIFALGQNCEAGNLKRHGYTFEITRKNEVESVYDLFMKEGNFYSGDGIKDLENQIARGLYYSLHEGEKRIGLGYIEVLERTPNYADIGMIVEPDSRQKGWGQFILKYLINECFAKNIIPTTCCNSKNYISRKTIHRAGFYLDGCLLLADL